MIDDEDSDEGIDPFLLELRLRNNAIRQRREALGFNQKQLGDAIGLSQELVSGYESLRLSPLRPNGEWKATALTLASFLGVDPDVLWSRAALAVATPVLRVKAREADVLRLCQTEEQRLLEQVASPEEERLQQELKGTVSRVLGTLTRRERLVINKRFGLENGEDCTLEEVAHEVLGTTAGRAQQIEAKALRKLRHPSRAHLLQDFNEQPRRKRLCCPHCQPPSVVVAETCPSNDRFICNACGAKLLYDRQNACWLNACPGCRGVDGMCECALERVEDANGNVAFVRSTRRG